MTTKQSSHRLSFVSLIILLSLALGCATAGQTGAVAGGGIGALAGQAIGGNTEATLIGAAVGTGIGYIIGNEADKKKAQQMSQATKSTNYDHTQVGPLANTRWKVVSLNPRNITQEFTSKIIEFDSKGHVTTTTTYPDGRVDVFNETYRVVGDTLIINKPGYIVNAKYSISGDQMIANAQDFSAVLQRI